MSTIPEPPYLLLVVGILASLASGKAFQVTLRQSLEEWSRSQSTRILCNLNGAQLLVPFLGITGGVSVFLASGLMIFGFPAAFSYSLSMIIAIAISLLIWSQLRRLLMMLEQGGSKALNLDAF